MSEPALPPSPAARPRRPIWWWFLLHGVVVLLWGALTLLTRIGGPAGWLVDGFALMAALAVVAIVLIVQASLARRDGGAGAWVLIVGGVLMLASVLIDTGVGLTGDAVAFFWAVMAYLVVEGVFLVSAAHRSPVFRVWGLLMGVLMLMAAGVAIGYWGLSAAAEGPDFDAMDLAFGVLGLLYGVGLVVAAGQVRRAELGLPVYP